MKPRDSMVVIEEEEETLEQPTNDSQPKNIITPSTQTQTYTTSIEQPQAPKLPPYPERLAIEKPIVLPEFDLKSELQNVCVKIPLLQSIKDFPFTQKLSGNYALRNMEENEKNPPLLT